MSNQTNENIVAMYCTRKFQSRMGAAHLCRMALRIRLCDPRLVQLVAVGDRGGARAAHDSGDDPQVRDPQLLDPPFSFESLHYSPIHTLDVISHIRHSTVILYTVQLLIN